MMRLSLEHVSGARQGEIDTLVSLPATIGSGPGVEVLVPGTAPHHAQVAREGRRVVLRDGGSRQGTLLAGSAVEAVPLHDGDILQLGAGGPRLRFHCAERMKLLEHRDFRIVLALVLLAGAGLGLWTYRLNREVAGLQQALEAAESERLRFEGRVEEQRHKGEAARQTVERRADEWRRREEELRRRLNQQEEGGDTRELVREMRRVRSRLVTLEGERTAGERIIRDYGAGVCVLQGSYGFYDAQGRALRYRLDRSGQKVREADGSVAVDVAGTGPVHSVDTVGTGFLVDRRGLVVTNRHVAEPWWKNETAEALAREGYKPRFIALRAFFPRVAEPLKAELRRVSPTVDLAVLEVDVNGRKIPTLPLEVSGRGAVPGQPVVVLGYPTGLEAILAKTDASIVEDILSSQGTSNERITEALSRRGLIRPSTTQGHIGDVTGTDIVFDAPTTHGGSGGPVFNKNRRVIAVEYAILPQFAGSSYGVPIRYALELTRRAREP
jgi:S1-C subfamily serine protease